MLGHAKGAIHYYFGDRKGCDNAMKAASRTAGVIGGGVVGSMVGGPLGGIVGGIAGGATLDGITTGADSAIHGEYLPAGQIAVVTKIVNGEATAGDVFDGTVGLITDAIAGYKAGNSLSKLRTARANTTLYRVTSKSEVKASVKAGKIVNSKPLGNNGELWMSESMDHTRPFFKSRKYEGKAAFEAKVPHEVYKMFKKEMIDQRHSRRSQLVQELQAGPANIINKERLHDNPQGKVNIGIKGDKNLKEFNQHMHGIREIYPDSWKYMNSFTEVVHDHGLTATAILHGRNNKPEYKSTLPQLPSYELHSDEPGLNYGRNGPLASNHKPNFGSESHSNGSLNFGQNFVSYRFASNFGLTSDQPSYSSELSSLVSNFGLKGRSLLIQKYN